MTKMYCYSSPLGFYKIVIAEQQLIEIAPCRKLTGTTSKEGLIIDVEKQLTEYFVGSRQQFELPFKLEGTIFQKTVWLELLKIPFGQTVSYGELAKKINKANAARAVGGACNKNKIAIIVPCHRVVGKNGGLVGYACGIEKKETLLSMEREKAV